jgi:hypothetical protein
LDVDLKRRYSREDLRDLQHPVLKRFFRVWETKRAGGRHPSRNDVSARDLAPFLPYVVLARAVDSDLEFRIIGHAIIQAYGENFTGRRLSSLTEAVGAPMVDAYRSVVAEDQPVLLKGSFEHSRDSHSDREVILTPLGPSDGIVDHVLAAGTFLPHVSRAAADTNDGSRNISCYTSSVLSVPSL